MVHMKRVWTYFLLTIFFCQAPASLSQTLSDLKKDQNVHDLRVANLYHDAEGNIVAAKFVHVPTGAPIFLLQIETAPEVLTWNDARVDSDRGLSHSLEHLLVGKGTKGRYLNLLEEMRLSQGTAFTYGDSVYFGLGSGAGKDGFFELFHALLDAIYRPDFSDLEAEREFYHFYGASDANGKKSLSEGGTVYNEMVARQDLYTYYYELCKRVFGDRNPLAFESLGMPEAMRDVTPSDIRAFHDKWYRIGSATGFIFSFPPQETLSDVLQRISAELEQFSQPNTTVAPSPLSIPRYPIKPSSHFEPGIYPFPGANPAAPGTIELGWRPVEAKSLVDLKLLELFFRGLAGGENSVLNRVIVDSRTRTSDLEATAVNAYLFPESEPRFPVPGIEISGIPGNTITVKSLEDVRATIIKAINDILQYPDQSADLVALNQIIATSAASQRRTDGVWMKNPPGFESGLKTDWRTYFERLELDSSFVRSLSQDEMWNTIAEELASGKNIWRHVIQKFRLLDTPYITAGVPSLHRQEELEQQRHDRARNKLVQLKTLYRVHDEQEALSRFEQDEFIKSKMIDEIDKRVPHPSFTLHPPMVPDEQIRYQQFELENVPVIASLFSRPPTFDVGLSFDLSKIPSKYYKYLSVLPDTFSSLGLKKGNSVVSYGDLSGRIQREVYSFSAAYETNPASGREDFTIRASATNRQEFNQALALIRDTMDSSYLDISNVARLRDILARRIADDQSDAGQATPALSSAYSFFYSKDRLFSALHSRFAATYWDERLAWRLHEHVDPGEIASLGTFARSLLTSPCGSRQDLFKKFSQVSSKGIRQELLEYWKRNLYSFPETVLCTELLTLAQEVQADLTAGPADTIRDLQALQKIVLNRRLLHLDLTMSEAALREVRDDLADFLRSIPAISLLEGSGPETTRPSVSYVTTNFENRYHISAQQRPLFLAIVAPDLVGGDVAFYADFEDYSRVDRQALVRALTSNLFAGIGPHSFYAKTNARGLAYNNYILSNPALKLMWYHADKISDIPSLIGFVNSVASTATQLQDPRLVDYVLSMTFSFSRSMLSFSDRGKALADDLRDHNEPDKIRRFSESILRLREESELSSILKRDALTSICGVLLRNDCQNEQRASNSLFVFVGTEQALSNAEAKVPIAGLLRLYPSDFWTK